MASGFRKVEHKHEVRLLHIKGKRQVRVVPVSHHEPLRMTAYKMLWTWCNLGPMLSEGFREFSPQILH